MSHTQQFHPRAEKGGDIWTTEKRMCFDIETANWTEVVALGALDEYRNEYHEWTIADCEEPIQEFVDMIMSRKYRSYRIIAHNGGRFDFGFLMDKLTQMDGIELSIIPRNGSAISVQIRKEGVEGQVRHLQDSVALLPRPLAQLGPAFAGVEKGGFDVTKIQADVDAMQEDGTWEPMLQYLEIDCRVLSKVIDGFIETASELLPTAETISPNLTIASTTMSIYRQYYQENSIPHASESAEIALREAYFGGRTEVFRHAHHQSEYGKLKHYDVNSLYPYVYGTMKHPVGKEMHLIDPTYTDLKSMDGIGGIVRIDGTVPEDVKYPVLPTREKIGNSEKVLFPVGDLSGWYELREVMYAEKVGAVTDIEVSEAYLYPLGEPFAEYTDQLYSMKNEIDKDEQPAKYNVVKLLLNSFWGKFGMQRDQSKVVQTPDRLPPEDSAAEALGNSLDAKTRNRQRGLYEVPERSEATYILPQIAVSVTALARIEMHKWMSKCVEKGGKIWYCDTDSIATNIELPESDELGGMDLEVIADEAYFISPKVYAERHTDGEIEMKAKGMKSDKLEVENSFDNFRGAVLENDPSQIGVEWTSPISPISNLRNNETMATEKRQRDVTQLDTKRNHDLDENDSRPLNISKIRRRKVEAEIKQTQARRRRDRYGKGFDRQYAGEDMNADSQQIDFEALNDSQLSAQENKQAVWEARKQQMR